MRESKWWANPVSAKICTRGVDALGSAIGVSLGKPHESTVTSAYVNTGRVTRTSRFQFLLKASNHIQLFEILDALA